MTDKRIEKLQELVHDLTKCGESAGIAIGDDLESVIESFEYDKDVTTEEDIKELLELAEGEIENLADIAKNTLSDIREIVNGEK